MPSQDFNTAATVKECTANAAITANAAVVLVIATEDKVDMPAAANSALFIGFALEAAASGAKVRVHMSGGIAKGVLGATTALGDFLMINGTSGDLKPVVLGSSDQYVVGKALRGGNSGDIIPVLIAQSIAQHT